MQAKIQIGFYDFINYYNLITEAIEIDPVRYQNKELMKTINKKLGFSSGLWH